MCITFCLLEAVDKNSEVAKKMELQRNEPRFKDSASSGGTLVDWRCALKVEQGVTGTP